jgi:photosystem II biogenesis protein Psp29
VVEELMVEMHLLSVNADFRFDPIYALGIVTAFDRFMQGYRPEEDKSSIFNALCRALNEEPQKYQQAAEQLKIEAIGLSTDQLLEQLKHLATGSGLLLDTLRGIANNPKFKYSRLFAIGLYSLLEVMSPELAKNEAKSNEVLQAIGEALHIQADKTQKDLELYRSNLDKLAQAQAVIDDILKADRKKKEERTLKDQSAPDNSVSSVPPTT